MIDVTLEAENIVANISAIIANIAPIDMLEKSHIQDTLVWLKSGVPIFRITKPNIPDKHLVCYFVLFDTQTQKILLVDHINAGLWLPAGGHVEINEDPIDTVRRECVEELGMAAEFLYENPIFLTSTMTVGITAGHTDVSLWYVLKGDSNQEYNFNTEEFKAVKWFSLDEIPYMKTDPHMQRFINKMVQR